MVSLRGSPTAQAGTAGRFFSLFRRCSQRVPRAGWEADQEDFLVLSGEALLIIEGEERPLRQWDFVHCPPKTNHVIIGAGEVPCLVLAVGGREHQAAPGWGGYSVDELALRHGAGVEVETADAKRAYARFRKYEPTPYQNGWLP